MSLEIERFTDAIGKIHEKSESKHHIYYAVYGNVSAVYGNELVF